MLNHDPFFHKTFRHSVVIFAKLFQLTVVRTDSDEDEVRRVKVPIMYGPKERWYLRTKGDEDLTKSIKLSSPRMSFQITGAEYDAQRALVKTYRNRKQSSEEVDAFVYNPAPWNLQFELNIIAKNQDDGHQVVEQILPFFRPEYTVVRNSIPQLELKDDVPVTLTGIQMSDNYASDFMSQRELTWTLTFEMKTYFYGPVRESKIIKKAQVDFLIPPSDGPVTDQQVAETPRSSRITNTVDPITADRDDPYDILTEIEYFDDGKKFNPVTGDDEVI